MLSINPLFFSEVNFIGFGVKTKFGKDLYNKIINSWLTNHPKSKDFDDDIDSFKRDVFYSANKFLYYKQHKLISSPQKDITYWIDKEWLDFKAFVHKLDCLSKTLKLSKSVQIVIENEYVVVLIPKTYQAACKYGRGTRWCITDSCSMSTFYNYTSNQKNVFYFLPKKCKEKYVFYIENDDWGHFTDKKDKIYNDSCFFFSLLKNNYQLTKLQMRVLFLEIKKYSSVSFYQNLLYCYRHQRTSNKEQLRLIM